MSIEYREPNPGGSPAYNSVPVSEAKPLPVKVVSGQGADRELLVTTYRCKTAFTGASSGDTITAARVLDVSAAAVTQIGATLWRNETTGLDLASAPAAANLELTGTVGLTDAQMAARGYALDGTDANGVTAPSGAAGIRGWLSALYGRSVATVGHAVNPLRTLGAAKSVTAGAASASVALSGSAVAVSVVAVGADIRFAVGVGAATASATSHLIQQGERLDFAVAAGTYVAALRNGTVSGTLEISEFA